MCQSSNSLPFILFSIVVMLLAQGAVQKGFQLQAFSPARDYVFCMNSTKKRGGFIFCFCRIYFFPVYHVVVDREEIKVPLEAYSMRFFSGIRND